jgi:GDP-mannose 6-dehydrogenase
VDVRVAEMIKYVNNSWHALKVAFANEIGTICHKLEINSSDLMDVFCNDHMLNLSKYYLKPGHSYGGACLPKDLSALVSLGNELELKLPLLGSVSDSNNEHIDRAFEHIARESEGKVIGFLGVAFKANTDDVRNSPSLELAARLIRSGHSLYIWDSFVWEAIEKQKLSPESTPELEIVNSYMRKTIEEVISKADYIVVGKRDDRIIQNTPNIYEKEVFDLVKIAELSDPCLHYAAIV